MNVQITELVAGRELDEAIAEKIMGWIPASGGYYYQNPSDHYRMVCMEPGDGAAPHWSPSTDIAAALEALDHWHGDYNIRRQNGSWCVTLFEPSMQYEDWAHALPLAICRALLKGIRNG